jgi:hypothetical protein
MKQQNTSINLKKCGLQSYDMLCLVGNPQMVAYVTGQKTVEFNNHFMTLSQAVREARGLPWSERVDNPGDHWVTQDGKSLSELCQTKLVAWATQSDPANHCPPSLAYLNSN